MGFDTGQITGHRLHNWLQLALSRNREYTADLEAAALTGDPGGLASALEVLDRHQGSWLKSLFGGRPPGPFTEWLQIHPPTDERIRRLLELDQTRELEPSIRSPAAPGSLTLGRPRALGRRLGIPPWH